MALRRKSKRSREAAALSKLDATPPWETRIRTEPDATTGPYDDRDHPDDGLARADLGALQVPISEGVDIQIEVDEHQHVISVSLVGADGAMQLMVFAAARNEGLWDEARAGVIESLKEQRAAPKEVADSAFGAEVTGTMAGPGGAKVPVRFAGVDGPRWMLRAMFSGSAADGATREQFEDLLRQVVVVRGTDPLPVGDAVPLTMPKEVQAQLDAQADGVPEQ